MNPWSTETQHKSEQGGFSSQIAIKKSIPCDKQWVGRGDTEVLCAFFHHVGKGNIIEEDVVKMLHMESTALILKKQGFPEEFLGIHSLRSGGAM